MAALMGQVGELAFTLQITRAATGKTEEVKMTSAINAEQLKQLQDANLIPKESDHGGNA
jgi:hypothetical protein